MTATALLTRVVWILAVAAAVPAIYGVWLFFRQNAIAFKPSRNLLGAPCDLGFQYEDVFLPISTSATVHGWWLPCSSSAKIVLYFPGSIGNISHELSTISFLRSFGVSILIIDYLGFGKSTGRPSEHGCYSSADGAWNYLISHKQCRPQDIIVFGRSLGATVAARVAAHHDCGGLVCHGALTSVPDFAAQLYPLLPAAYFCYLRFNTRKYIRSCRCPVLVFHAEKDTVIPVTHGKSIFGAIAGPRKFLKVRGDHYGSTWRDTPELRTLFAMMLAGEVETWV